MGSYHDIGDCQSFLLALERLHTLFATHESAIVRHLEYFLDVLVSVLGLEELEVAKGDHRFNYHADGYLDFDRESILTDNILETVILQELIDFLHAGLPGYG